MSPTPRDIDILKEIVDVRRLQTRASEQALAEAALAASDALRTQTSADGLLAERQADWLAVFRQDRLELHLAGAINAAVQQADQNLAVARAHCATADQHREMRRQALQQAEARTQTAERVYERSLKSRLRRLEEHRLSELADRSARRKPSE